MQRAPHQPLMAQSPLFQITMVFSLGILGGRVLAFSSIFMAVLSACLSLAAVIMLLKRRLALASFCLAMAFVSSGFLLAQSHAKDVAFNQLRKLLDDGTIKSGDPVELTGIVDGPVEEARDAFHFTLKIEQVRGKDIEQDVVGLVEMIGGLRSTESRSRYEQLQLRHGARLRIMTTLRRSDSFRNPGVQVFTEYLDRRGFDATCFIKSPLLVERLDDEKVFLPLAWLYQWRSRIQKQIDSHFSADTAGVLDAALLGNRYNLLPDTAERFRDGGTFHVLVISGLHISFIGVLVLVIARRLTRIRGLQFTCSVAVIWSYTLAVGAEASVVRSALMFTIVALAPVMFRQASSLNALGGAALFLLVWRPQNLFDPSFQLTFLSVLAIVIVAVPVVQKMTAIGSWRPTYADPYPPLCPNWLRILCECLYWSEREWKEEMAQSVYHYRLRKSPYAAWLERLRLQRPIRYIFNALVVSLGVQIFLLPFLILYFHRLSLASIVLNIGVSVLMAVLAIVALVALLLLSVNTAAAWPLVALGNGLNWLMVHSVDPFSRIGIASLRLPQYSGKAAAIYVLYYVPLIVLTIALSRWNPLRLPGAQRTYRLVHAAVVSQIIVFALLILHPLSAGRPDGRLRVDFLDVGQGDSALVTMPDGSTLLIDGGGKPSFSRNQPDADDELPQRDPRSIGEIVVSEYLWWRGLDSIDYILATHADADHIDGLNDVARNFKVRAALVARAPMADAEFRKFAETLRSRAVPVSLVGRGDVFHFGPVTATVLWPPATDDVAATSGNNDSIVLRLQFGRHSILLTGDVESATERQIVNSSQDLHSDVVKVAHHGSKTSSIGSFVESTQPSFAVISVGQTSVFGHPNRDVVERWKTAGATVLTTGGSGSITVTTDGNDLRVQLYSRR